MDTKDGVLTQRSVVDQPDSAFRPSQQKHTGRRRRARRRRPRAAHLQRRRPGALLLLRCTTGLLAMCRVDKCCRRQSGAACPYAVVTNVGAWFLLTMDHE